MGEDLNLNWVLFAGAAAWLGLGLYLSALALRQSALARRLARLEAMSEREE